MTDPNPSETSKKTILCIDDDTAGLTLRKMMLESEGYEVFIAGSGEEGLALLQTHHVDAIVLDYQMPTMNGADVARFIRESRPDLPIVLLSGYVEDIPSAALNLVNAFVTKGGSPGQLLHVVRSTVGRRVSGRLTILNVDDNDQNRYAISRVLKDAGFDVIEAKTGREAIDLASCRPSLVILDINLPDMLGFDVCRQLKSSVMTRDIPVIHISATHPGRIVNEESMDSGAVRFVEHPMDLSEVVKIIQQELEKHAPPDTHLKAEDQSSSC
jgi:CheY-like chemotaxis protein